ncbi:hypothetical protein C8J56DRAFT_757761, partial [Mycena floridula]
TTHPIVDEGGRTVGLLAGAPSGDGHARTIAEAERVFHQAHDELHFSAAHKHHRRGDYETMGLGISFGGGQMSPGNLSTPESDQKALKDL